MKNTIQWHLTFSSRFIFESVPYLSCSWDEETIKNKTIKQSELRKHTAILFFRNLGMQQKSWLKYPLNLHILLNLRIFYFCDISFLYSLPTSHSSNNKLSDWHKSLTWRARRRKDKHDLEKLRLKRILNEFSLKPMCWYLVMEGIW